MLFIAFRLFERRLFYAAAPLLRCWRYAIDYYYAC